MGYIFKSPRSFSFRASFSNISHKFALSEAECTQYVLIKRIEVIKGTKSSGVADAGMPPGKCAIYPGVY
jgi:hypothetical protein